MKNRLLKIILAATVLALGSCTSLPDAYKVESREVRIRLEEVSRMLHVPVNSVYYTIDRDKDKMISQEETDMFFKALYEIIVNKWPSKQVLYDEALEN